MYFFLFKLAISSFYDTMGEDEGNVRQEPPEEVEQVSVKTKLNKVYNLTDATCVATMYKK